MNLYKKVPPHYIFRSFTDIDKLSI